MSNVTQEGEREKGSSCEGISDSVGAAAVGAAAAAGGDHGIETCSR